MRFIVAYAIVIALGATMAVYVGTRAQTYVEHLYADLNHTLDKEFK